MAEPYREWVGEVIDEEFSRLGISLRELPERVQEALQNAQRRFAASLEFNVQRRG